MGSIGQSLKRKFGPLPAWAWLGIGGIALWLYRRHQAGSTTAASIGTGTAANTADYGPYGEGAYGNGSGGGTSGSGGGGTDPGTGSGTTQPASPVINIAPPATVSSPPGKSKLPKLIGKGAIRATSGSKKPKAKKGYTVKGLGSGNWEYEPNKDIHTRSRKTKTKSQAKPAKPASKKSPTRTAATAHPSTSRSKTTKKAAPKTRARVTR